MKNRFLLGTLLCILAAVIAIVFAVVQKDLNIQACVFFFVVISLVLLAGFILQIQSWLVEYRRFKELCRNKDFLSQDTRKLN